MFIFKYRKKMETNTIAKKDAHVFTDYLCVRKSSYELKSRGKESKYFLQNIVRMHPCIHTYIHPYIHQCSQMIEVIKIGL